MRIATCKKDDSASDCSRRDNFCRALRLIGKYQRNELPAALTPLQEKQAYFMAYMKSTLERSGYTVMTRCKLNTILQVELSWKNTPLLVATLEIVGNIAHMKTAAGLARRDIVDKNGNFTTIQTSHKAFNDFMRVQLEALAPIVDLAEGSLQGHGSYEWFQKNIPGAEDLAQGNTIIMRFDGARYDAAIEYNADEVLNSAKANAASWNNTTPDYNFSDIKPEDYDRVIDVPVSRNALHISMLNRNINGPTASVDPGWNGVSGSSELRERLDSLEPTNFYDFSAQVGDDFEEELDMAFACDWEQAPVVKKSSAGMRM